MGSWENLDAVFLLHSQLNDPKVSLGRAYEVFVMEADMRDPLGSLLLFSRSNCI
jgi:hypothetical protein